MYEKKGNSEVFSARAKLDSASPGTDGSEAAYKVRAVCYYREMLRSEGDSSAKNGFALLDTRLIVAFQTVPLFERFT